MSTSGIILMQILMFVHSIILDLNQLFQKPYLFTFWRIWALHTDATLKVIGILLNQNRASDTTI